MEHHALPDTTVHALVTHSAILRQFPAAALASVQAHLRLHQLAPQQFLFHQGDPAAYLYFLCDGRLRIEQLAPNGQQIVVGLLQPVREIGILAAVPDSDYPLSARAISDATLYALSAAHLQHLCESYPSIRMYLMQITLQRSMQIQQQIIEQTTLNTEQRLARTPLRLAWQHDTRHTSTPLHPAPIPLSRQHLAAMTGNTHSTISRIMSGWEQQGMLATQRIQITIHDLPALRQIAGNPPPEAIPAPPYC